MTEPYSINSTVANNVTKYFFYKRSDHNEILNLISPMRSYVLKAIPYLHYVGLITNALALTVLLEKSLMARKSIIFLCFLAFSDFMYNFLSQLPNALMDMNIVDYDIFKQSNFSCFFYDLRMTTFHFYSVILTTFVTLDRFLHIYQPMKLNRSYSSLKSKMMIGVLLFIVAFIIALPHGFLMVYSEIEKDCDAHSFFKKKFFNSSVSNYQIYFTFTEPFIIWFIPGLLILIMNSVVIYKILESSKFQSKNYGNFELYIFLRFLAYLKKTFN